MKDKANKMPAMPKSHPQNDMMQHSNAEVEAHRKAAKPLMNSMHGYCDDRQPAGKYKDGKY